LRTEFDVDVEYCAFDLHPGIPPEGQLIPWPPDQLAQRSAQFRERAEAEGLEVGERRHWYDSRPAHEASLWAREQGAASPFRKGIYRAYFVQDRNIGSADVLAEIAKEADLDDADLRKALAAGRYRDAVTEQYEAARSVGVTAVPTFVADGKALVGAHPYENFLKLMEIVGASKRT
jgi:predicted DsbA family dithiol-disulfide isomerase